MIGLNSRERQLIKVTLLLLTFRLHSRSWPSVRCFDLQIRVGSRFSQFRFGSDLNDEYRYRLRLRPVAIKVYIQKSRRNKNRLILSKRKKLTPSQHIQPLWLYISSATLPVLLHQANEVRLIIISRVTPLINTFRRCDLG